MHVWLLTLLKVSVLLFGLLGLLSCSQASLRLQVRADEHLNANPESGALPVVVRIYQLSEVSAFERASFEALWREDATVLSESLLLKHEIHVSPGMNETGLKMSRQQGARYVGVVALFRDPSGNHWRSVAYLPPRFALFPVYVTLNLEGNRVRVKVM